MIMLVRCKKKSALLVLCEGNIPTDSPLKGQWRGDLMFSLICAWTNGWANNRDAGDLWHHRVHYDVHVMPLCSWSITCQPNIAEKLLLAVITYSIGVVQWDIKLIHRCLNIIMIHKKWVRLFLPTFHSRETFLTNNMYSHSLWKFPSEFPYTITLIHALLLSRVWLNCIEHRSLVFHLLKLPSFKPKWLQNHRLLFSCIFPW